MTVSNSQPKSASQPLLCLTITGYKKPGMPDDEYRAYMAKQHASLVGPLMEEYGIVSYTQVSPLRPTPLNTILASSKA